MKYVNSKGILVAAITIFNTIREYEIIGVNEVKLTNSNKDYEYWNESIMFTHNI